jgi:hypothetical protein
LLVAIAAYYVLVRRGSPAVAETELSAGPNSTASVGTTNRAASSGHDTRLSRLGIVLTVLGLVVGVGIGALGTRDTYDRRYRTCMHEMGWQADIQVSPDEPWPSVVTQQRRFRCMEIAR